jgi:hypothetical protein
MPRDFPARDPQKFVPKTAEEKEKEKEKEPGYDPRMFIGDM